MPSRSTTSDMLRKVRDDTREDLAEAVRLGKHLEAYYECSKNCAAPQSSIAAHLYGVRERALAALMNDTDTGTVSMWEAMGGATSGPAIEATFDGKEALAFLRQLIKEQALLQDTEDRSEHHQNATGNSFLMIQILKNIARRGTISLIL